MNGYIYGAVLLLEPEHDRQYFHDCCGKMRDLGMNTAVIWPPVFYSGDGTRSFSRQLRLLDAAAGYGLRIIIELTGQVTNLEYMPDWLYTDEYAVRNFDGSIEKMQNGIGELNYNHPFVKQQIREFFFAAAAAFKDHPALFGWDIWNESHFKSYDAWTLAEFQCWLERKYGTIGNLNFNWKKSYTGFRQVKFDKVTWASIMPDVDWEEFRTDNLASIAAELSGWIRENDPNHPVIADNVMSNAVWSEFDRGSDDWKLARTVDFFGISFYPKTGGRLLKINEPWLRSLTFAGAAAAGGGSFMISEMQSHYYSEIYTAERVAPEELIAWNCEAIFHGCHGCIYWKWSPFKTGFQLGGRGLVLADGSLSKRGAAAAELGQLFNTWPGLAGLRRYTRAGMLYDRNNNFIVKNINNRIRHLIGDDQPACARFGLQRLCWERNLPLKVTTPETLEADLAGLQVLFLPYQVSLDEASCERLRAFVEGGGSLVASYPFIDISADGRLYERLPGGPLNDLVGAVHLDNMVIDGSLITLADGEPLSGIGHLEVQELRLEAGSEILARAGELPLIFRRRYGKGEIVYAAASVWNLAHDSHCDGPGCLILDFMLREYPELAPVCADIHVELAEGFDADYLLISNYESKAEGRVELPEDYGRIETVFGDSAMQRDERTLTFSQPRIKIIRMEKKTS